MRNTQGEISHWYGTCTDIDEQKRTGDALRRANQDLEQFAYSISHDLREPLRTMLLYTELIQRRCSDALAPQANQYLAYLSTSAQRMDAMIRALRTYTSTADVDHPDSPSTDASDAARDAILNLKKLTGEHRGVIETAPLPMVSMHHHYLVQILQNLLVNSLTYQSGTTVPRISISSVDHATMSELLVRDNGIGIPEEYHERIFGMFRRLHTAREFPGSGMGLAICKKIVEIYSVSMKVTSTPGAGSTFHICIPKRHSVEATHQRSA